MDRIDEIRMKRLDKNLHEIYEEPLSYGCNSVEEVIIKLNNTSYIIERYYYDEEHPLVKGIDELTKMVKDYQKLSEKENCEQYQNEIAQNKRDLNEQIERVRDLVEDYPEVVKVDKNLRFEQEVVHDR